VPEELQPIWDAVRGVLRRETPDFQFHIWLEPLELAGVEGRTLFVRAPDHIRTWVGERYLPVVRAAAARAFDEHATVEIVGPEWAPPERAGTRTGREPRGETPLNPKYTFEQFVIGGGNRFAHAACLAAAELPAQAYNPLFLYGRPGLGKTHLLHAIGNYVRRFGGGLSVRYATVDDFTSAFVDSLREGRTAEFKERFRRADVVLIDDVQFLAHKERTREEFFHTFNSLYESGRQLVVTSDHSPEELPELEDRLVERFRSGLVVELDAPAFEVRRAILEKRAGLDGVEASGPVLDEIALGVTSSVRALEGALVRVIAYASLKREELTPGLARDVLGRLGAAPASSSCGIPEIVDAAAREFGVSREDLLARNRRPAVATARHVAMYLARELTGHSLPEIGRGIGGRNHTTVLHAVNRVNAAVRRDERLRDAVDNLRSRLGPGA
jgi:chromosomal replication initiator protein